MPVSNGSDESGAAIYPPLTHISPTLTLLTLAAAPARYRFVLLNLVHKCLQLILLLAVARHIVALAVLLEHASELIVEDHAGVEGRALMRLVEGVAVPPEVTRCSAADTVGEAGAGGGLVGLQRIGHLCRVRVDSFVGKKRDFLFYFFDGCQMKKKKNVLNWSALSDREEAI